MAIQLTIIGLVVGASVSPLLTFANLWQIKEWRIDRLKEHLRSEGWFSQLFGKIRPGLLILFVLLGISGMRMWQNNLLLVLVLLNCAQIAARRQPKPVWTLKAIAIVGLSLLINIYLAYQLPATDYRLPILIPYIQPFVAFVAWLAFYPIDRFLKQRILKQAKNLREKHSDITVIGITGSVGKTTTKELLKHVLAKHSMLATPEYVNSEIGVARWLIANLPKKPEVMVVEMGAYRKGEIATLSSIAKQNMGIITSIGRQHLALFGSQEQLRDAKAEIIDALPADGHAFLNADNALCVSVKKQAPCPTTMVGTGGTADLEAYDIEETANGMRFTVQQQQFDIPLHGTHNITNVLFAIAVSQKLGITLPKIAAQLRSFHMPESTFSVTKQNTITLLNDTHNASPSSFRAGLRWAQTQPADYCVLLTSGLQELGKDQDATHTELGSLAAGVCDRVVFLHKRNAKHFEKGYEKPVELFSATTEPVPPNSLLLCIGRLPKSAINQLLQ